MSDREPPPLTWRQRRRIRRWHERARRELRARVRPQEIDYLGLQLVVPPGVMPIVDTSHLLGTAVAEEVADPAVRRVLDMGTGSGVNALVAARGAASVVAVDVNPEAVTAARANAARNGLDQAVEVRRSDVFAAVPERFDLVVFDPPFRWFAPRDLAEAAITDENYRALTAFFEEVREHLTPDGRVLVFFGTSGDVRYLHRLGERAGFRREVVARTHVTRRRRTTEYRTFRLVPR
ncbi:hypothetical protein GCM10027174_07480 [Salinifilum aidingensis]